MVRVDKKVAKRLLHEVVEELDEEVSQPDLATLVREVIAACEGTSQTPIAALGTALLAKATEPSVDALSLKAGDESPGAYSARGLATAVLAPESMRLGIHLGVTGREPLNNQPFFRSKRISRDMEVKSGKAAAAIDALCTCLEKVEDIGTAEAARDALREFVRLRSRPAPEPLPQGIETPVTPMEFTELIARFVGESSQGGKRAQAVAAGLLSVVAGTHRVLSGRVNDPDRRFPGDVAIVDNVADLSLQIAYEVRDKPARRSDVEFFLRKALEAEVRRVGFLAVASSQPGIDADEVVHWALERGVVLRLHTNWADFLYDLLFWTHLEPTEAIPIAYELIYERLAVAEVGDNALARWRNWRDVVEGQR